MLGARARASEMIETAQSVRRVDTSSRPAKRALRVYVRAFLMHLLHAFAILRVRILLGVLLDLFFTINWQRNIFATITYLNYVFSLKYEPVLRVVKNNFSPINKLLNA